MINRAADIPGRVIFTPPGFLLERGAVPILRDRGITPVDGPHYFLALGFGETPRGRVGVWAPLFSRASCAARLLLDPAAQAGYWSRNGRETCVDLRQFWIVPVGVLTVRRDQIPDSYDVTAFPVSVEHAAKDALARYRRGVAAPALEGEAA